MDEGKTNDEHRSDQGEPVFPLFMEFSIPSSRFLSILNSIRKWATVDPDSRYGFVEASPDGLTAKVTLYKKPLSS